MSTDVTEEAVHAKLAEMLDVDPAQTVEVAARDLYRVLEAVLPHADGSELPGLDLECVRVEAGNGVLCATATDRYTAAHARTAATGSFPQPLHLAAAELRGICAVLKVVGEADATTGTSSTATLTPGTERRPRLTVTVRDLPVSAEVEDGLYWPGPALSKMFTEAPTAESANLRGPIVLNQALLGKFAVLQQWALEDGYSPTRGLRVFFGGPKSPVRIEFADWFTAVLMPMSGDGRLQVGERSSVPFGLPSTTETATKEV